MTTAQERRLDLLLLCAKQYIFACKIALKTPCATELQRKIETHWKIENVSNSSKLVWLQTLLYCFSYTLSMYLLILFYIYLVITPLCISIKYIFNDCKSRKNNLYAFCTVM